MKKIVLIITVIAMVVGLCACGQKGEVVNTTSKPEQTEATDTSNTTKVTESSAKGNEDETSGADYKAVYKKYSKKMESAAATYKEELQGQVGSLSKDQLYDATKEKIDALNDIRQEGSSEMVELMLASTADDQEDYEKWYKALSTSFSNLSQEIREIYTNNI